MSIVLFKYERDETAIGVWDLVESVEELKKGLLLNEEEIAFINSLRKGKRNIHWLASRMLLRKLLKADSFVEVVGDEHGKPHLVNFDYEISISHSYGYAAAMISKKKVGIDIESIKPVIEKIAFKFLSDKEFSEIGNEIDRLFKLYVYWSAKEAIFKLNGKRQLSFKDHITIHPFEYKKSGYIEAEIHQPDFNKNLKVWYEQFGKYMLTYVIDD